MQNNIVFLGSDHAGFNLKVSLINSLKLNGRFEVVDCGCFNGVDAVNYVDIAKLVCDRVLLNKARAILCCGTGVGMSIAANKLSQIRAACTTDYFSAKFSRLHNDANVLCLGERVIGYGAAIELVDVFLTTPFEGGRHIARLQKLEDI